MFAGEIGCKDVDWIQLTRDRVQRRTVMNTAMNIRIRNSRQAERLSASQVGFWPLELDNRRFGLL